MSAALVTPSISDTTLRAPIPPRSATNDVIDVLHGVAVRDPYRWLEDATSPATQAWIGEQARYARMYLDNIPHRETIRHRVEAGLDIENYDSLQKVGRRYFFRKRLPGQEQPCIYMREGANGEDQCLVDPSARGEGPYMAVKPRLVSPDGRLLLYEIKQGGERSGTFELLEIDTRKCLSDRLPRGYLRGFAFTPDGKGFYYIHEALEETRPLRSTAYRHTLGAPFSDDRNVLSTAGDKDPYLSLFADDGRLVLLSTCFAQPTRTDVYFLGFDENVPNLVLRGVEHLLGLRTLDGKIVALTDHEAPNRKVVELRAGLNKTAQWTELIPESDASIRGWLIAGDRITLQYTRNMTQWFALFDYSGQQQGQIPVPKDRTMHLLASPSGSDELFLAEESFVEPLRIFRYSPRTGMRTQWSRSNVPIAADKYDFFQVSYPSKDGTLIPIYLVGRPEVLTAPSAPTIMTSYGGYGIAMTPQFSVFVALLMEMGCLFALPNIRGGSEFGAAWHLAARRRNRQTAFDDFLCAAKWLIQTGRTDPQRLAIFGGSNSGLLVGTAVTQRPDLFRAALCMVPMLDMLRYHLFDQACAGKEEFGTADDPLDFAALRAYSPYHNVRDGTPYPAIMLVSGDADQNCNALHARKMTARLQTANASPYPIFLDYSRHRGHSSVLPLSTRIEALTDRVAFLCDQLHLLQLGGAKCGS